jgi:hypothetical protein
VKSVLLIGACFLLSGCPASGPNPTELKLQHLPPTPKDVIEIVMHSSQFPLSDASCKGFGTELTDKTIGRYLAGYLAELSSQDARNALTTTVEPDTENGVAVYKCRLMIRHAQGEDIWSWGVQFQARQSDGVVISQSMQCVGAG